MTRIESLLFYLVNFFIIVLLIKIFDYVNSKNKKISKFFLILPMILLTWISGYRYYVGADYSAYVNMYNQYSYLNIGSRFLYDIANFISDNSQTIIVLYAFLTNLFLFLIIYKMKDRLKNTYLIMATYLFVYFPFSLNIIRQTLSIMIVLYLLLLCEEKKYIKAFIFLILAIMIHSSAVVLIPYFLLYIFDKNENKSNKIIILTILLIAGIIMYSLFLGNIFGIKRYFGYMSKFNFKDIEITTIYSYAPFMIISILYSNIIKKNINIKLLSIFFYSGVIWEFLFSSTQIFRIGMYFSITLIILIPALINKTKNIHTKSFVVFVYILFLTIYFVVVFYLVGRAGIFPYNNIIFVN